MKLLFYILVFGLIVFLNLGLFIPSLLAVDEEDIRGNINRLKKSKWFQELLGDEKYNQLIVHDKDVRRVDRKSTRLNSSHVSISYAVFCLKKKKKKITVLD